jgi:nickel-dependent lactate racemase
MAKIQVPFETAEESGVYLELEVPDKNLVGSFIPKEPPSLPEVPTAAAYALEHPLGSKPLSRLVRRGDKVVIITENQFRAAPAHQVLPPLLDTIRSAGGEATIAIGNGKVPPLSPQEIEHKLGKDVIASGIPIECNDVSKPENYVFVGITPRGVPLFVLKSVAEADVKITISTVQATLWGYGGSGMIIPAVSGNETIEMNHVTYVGAGDFVQAHKAAIRAYDDVYRFRAAQFAGAPADIVITGSSAPTNHLFFHTGWAVVNCDPICKDGGTIIQATPCPGYGEWPGFALMDLMKEYMPPSPENQAKALRAFYTKDRELWAGCIWWKIYEVMTRKDVTIVTNKENIGLSRQAGFKATDSLPSAFDAALKRHGPNARVAFVPYGRYTVLDL